MRNGVISVLRVVLGEKMLAENSRVDLLLLGEDLLLFLGIGVLGEDLLQFLVVVHFLSANSNIL